MILVLVEVSPAGGAVETSREAVTFARDLAAVGGGVPVDVVLVGALDDALVGVLASYGERRIHALTGAAYDSFSGAAWAAGLVEVRERAGSVVVMAAGTPRGNEVLAHVAARLAVPMAANVVSFGGLSPFTVTRQVVGGAVQKVNTRRFEVQVTEQTLVHEPPEASRMVRAHAGEFVEVEGTGTAEIDVAGVVHPTQCLIRRNRTLSRRQAEHQVRFVLQRARKTPGDGPRALVRSLEHADDHRSQM